MQEICTMYAKILLSSKHFQFPFLFFFHFFGQWYEFFPTCGRHGHSDKLKKNNNNQESTKLCHMNRKLNTRSACSIRFFFTSIPNLHILMLIYITVVFSGAEKFPQEDTSVFDLGSVLGYVSLHYLTKSIKFKNNMYI